MNTHYAVVMFSGDPAGEHPDPELRWMGPSMKMVACGPEDFCTWSLVRWTTAHPLRMWETGEILSRTIVPTPLERLTNEKSRPSE